MGTAKDKQRSMEEAVLRLREKNTSYRVYTENDIFTMAGEPAFSVLEYWRFMFSQLNNQHETIAEYLVNRALGAEKAENVSSWTGYDLSYRAKRIEVKASSYIHTWNRKRVSQTRTFSIAPSSNLYWYGQRERDGKTQSRQSEIYIFCLNTNQDIENVDPLNLDYWEFYVVPTFVIDARCDRIGNPDQKKISLSVVKRLSQGCVGWTGLRERVDAAIDMVDKHIEELDGSMID